MKKASVSLLVRIAISISSIKRLCVQCVHVFTRIDFHVKEEWASEPRKPIVFAKDQWQSPKTNS